MCMYGRNYAVALPQLNWELLQLQVQSKGKKKKVWKDAYNNDQDLGRTSERLLRLLLLLLFVMMMMMMI